MDNMSNSNSSLSHFKDYLELEKKYSKNTSLAYCQDIAEFQNFLNETQNGILVKDVIYVLIRSWIIYLLDNSNSSKTINRKMASLKCYFNFLIKTIQLDSSPMDTHKSIRFPKIKQIPFSEEEMKSLFNNFPKEQDFVNTRDRLILELLYSTGIRRMELINLKQKNVNLQQKMIKVLGKRNKERLIPLIPSLIPFLNSYMVQKNEQIGDLNSTYLFVNKKNGKISETLVYRLVKKHLSFVSEKVKKSPHMLRHSFATHLINNGAGINSVKELLGHSSLASTQVYAHSNLKELQNAYKNAHPRNKDRTGN
ncbi:MAG: integrase/recombinase XerC [Flavobacterium sp.]|jgi:integrase/recombinase XerC